MCRVVAGKGVRQKDGLQIILSWWQARDVSYVIFSFQLQVQHSPRTLLSQDWCKHLIIVAVSRSDTSHLDFTKQELRGGDGAKQ